MTYLLDANVLCALFIDTHVHHERSDCWFAKLADPFATCAVTQGALLRLHMNFASDQSSQAAWASLRHLTTHPQHQFWDAGFGYDQVPYRNIQGHRQVTDAWLVALVRKKKAQLVTFDKGLVANYPKLAISVPETP